MNAVVFPDPEWLERWHVKCWSGEGWNGLPKPRERLPKTIKYEGMATFHGSHAEEWAREYHEKVQKEPKN